MKYDAIVLHTCGMSQHDARISGWKPNLDAHVRTAATAEIYHASSEGKGPKIIISGGKINGEGDPAVSHVLKEELVRKYGVPESDIWLEDLSVDSTENVEFSLDKLMRNRDKISGNSIAVVTNSSYDHLGRCLWSYDDHNDGFGITGESAEVVLLRRAMRFSSGRLERFVLDYSERRREESADFDNKLYFVTRMPGGEKLLRLLTHLQRD